MFFLAQAWFHCPLGEVTVKGAPQNERGERSASFMKWVEVPIIAERSIRVAPEHAFSPASSGSLIPKTGSRGSQA